MKPRYLSEDFLKKTLINNTGSHEVITGYQTLEEFTALALDTITKNKIFIDENEVHPDDVKQKLKEYLKYKVSRPIPRNMLAHAKYISQVKNITTEEALKKFFPRIVLGVLLEDLFSENTIGEFNIKVKGNISVIHEIISNLNHKGYLGATERILNAAFSKTAQKPTIVPQNLTLTFSTVLQSKDSNSIICDIDSDTLISGPKALYGKSQEVVSSNLRFCIESAGDNNKLSYSLNQFQLQHRYTGSPSKGYISHIIETINPSNTNRCRKQDVNPIPVEEIILRQGHGFIQFANNYEIPDFISDHSFESQPRTELQSTSTMSQPFISQVLMNYLRGNTSSM